MRKLMLALVPALLFAAGPAHAKDSSREARTPKPGNPMTLRILGKTWCFGPPTPGVRCDYAPAQPMGKSSMTQLLERLKQRLSATTTAATTNR